MRGRFPLFGICGIAAVFAAASVLSRRPASESPEVFAPGVISTADFESHLQISPDGNELYFVKSTPQFTDWKIWTSRRIDGKWTPPAAASFSGKYRDADPFITRDGKRMFFISDRPVDGKPKADMDVWVMKREGAGWGEPAHLGSEVNSATDEWYPTLADSGTLYFGSSRKGSLGGVDLWCAKPAGDRFEEAQNLGAPINSQDEEVEPFVLPDESAILFSGYRSGSLGGLDLYVSQRTATGWSEPRHLEAPISSRGTELAPKLSYDGKTFYFASARSQGRLGDIFKIDAKALKLAGDRPLRL